MKRLSIEISQPTRDPQRIRVCLSRQEGPIAGAEQEVTLPWDDDFALPIVLKILDTPLYSRDLFTERERRWLVQNQFVYKYRGGYLFEENVQKKIGAWLYNTLIGENLQTHFRAAWEEAKQADEALHLEIRFGQEAGLISAYPWELLFDGVDFLCRGGACLLTRYIVEESSPAPIRSVTNKLKILLISPRPSTPDMEKLLQPEVTAVRQVFEKFAWDQSVEVKILHPPTFSRLIQYLQEKRGEAMPHVLHFDGHGVFGRRCPNPNCRKVEPDPKVKECICDYPLGDPQRTSQGFLVFENEQGESDYISGEELAEQLRMAIVMSQGSGAAFEGLCLAVLSACESAALQGKSVFNGVAQRLIHARIPAVVAMQFSVTENDALEFVNTFYQNIADSQPLVKAVFGGRSKLLSEKPDQWYRPVLYLRWREHEGGRLFDIGPALRYPGGPDYFVKKTMRLERDEGTAKIAVDQTMLVKDFVKMLIPEWRKNFDFRLLLLEGKENTGKTTVLKRFVWCCKKVQETEPLLFAEVKLEQKLGISLADLAADVVQRLVTSAEGLRELEERTGKLKELLDELKSPVESRSSGLNIQDPQALGRGFYKQLNRAGQGFTIVLLLDNYDALFPVESGLGVKSFLVELAEGVKEVEFPNCIFAAVTSTRSLRAVPVDLVQRERTIDLTDINNVKYYEAVSQIGVGDVKELALEEFGIEIKDRGKAQELIERARNSFGVTDIQVLRSLLGAHWVQSYLTGGG